MFADLKRHSHAGVEFCRPSGLDASIIIGFYNDIELLRLILDVLSEEIEYTFEVLIADDGSTQDARDAICRFKDLYSFRIAHIWQEDLGFRKPKVLNKAVLESVSEVLIFLDGDCLPQRRFLKGHLVGRSRAECRAGRRVDLHYDFLSSLNLFKPSHVVRYNFFRLLVGVIRGRVRHLEKALWTPNWFRWRHVAKSASIVGCNFSVDRELLFVLNGFDSRGDFPWGSEDADIERRLRLFGAPIVAMFGRSTAFHFDKNYSSRSSPRVDLGMQMFQKVREDNLVATKFGLAELSRDGSTGAPTVLR
jgi:glycosyltransferase involved in cell wall biosynthesis